MSVAGPSEAQLPPASAALWVSVILKRIDVLSAHLSDQHKRLQQEIYVRLAARSGLLNYSIATAGGLAGIVAFIFPRLDPANGRATLFDQGNLVPFAVVSVVCFLAAFAFLFFYMNYLSHSGYIYTASRQITEQFPAVLLEIEELCNAAGRECGMPEHLVHAMQPEKIFSWERQITETREQVKFTDSQFEIQGYIALSALSFVLSILALLAFLVLLVSHNGILAMLTAAFSGATFLIFFGLYFAAFARCNRTRKSVKAFRDKAFPPILAVEAALTSLKAASAKPASMRPSAPRGR